MTTPRSWRRPFRDPPGGHFLLAHIGRDEARSFVRTHHRHHPPPQGAIVHLGCWALWEAPAAGVVLALLGVAFLGRPVSRVEQDRGAWEVTRLAVGPRAEHACSALYGYARRVAQLLNPGVVVLDGQVWRFKSSTITYTLGSEGGGQPQRRRVDARGRRPGPRLAGLRTATRAGQAVRSWPAGADGRQDQMASVVVDAVVTWGYVAGGAHQ